MKSCKYLFLEKSILGHDIDYNNQDDVINKCIRLAYKDMLDAGRYYIDNNYNKTNCEKFKKLLEEYKYVFSKELIKDTQKLFGETDKIGNKNKYVTRFGLSQKLVNMFFKYSYVFSDYIAQNIDFTKCDCPLDSIILNSIKYNENTWSKITESQYDECQGKIKNILSNKELNEELKSISNLAYDFIAW